MMTLTSKEAHLFDATRCELGEGPLWHPELNALFWFDVLGQKLFMRSTTQFRQWLFPEIVSAAGWVDRDTLLVAGETTFWQFDIATGAHEKHVPLDAHDASTRSNDGRVDPWGGFWIGTMGKGAEKAPGASTATIAARSQHCSLRSPSPMPSLLLRTNPMRRSPIP